jgi:methionyl-tRNA formyltransferase
MRLSVDRVAIHSLPPEQGRLRVPCSPGTILETTPRFLIATFDDPLEILELQPAGKRSMPAADFLRGNRVSTSDRFGPA